MHDIVVVICVEPLFYDVGGGDFVAAGVVADEGTEGYEHVGGHEEDHDPGKDQAGLHGDFLDEGGKSWIDDAYPYDGCYAPEEAV